MAKPASVKRLPVAVAEAVVRELHADGHADVVAAIAAADRRVAVQRACAGDACSPATLPPQGLTPSEVCDWLARRVAKLTLATDAWAAYLHGVEAEERQALYLEVARFAGAPLSMMLADVDEGRVPGLTWSGFVEHVANCAPCVSTKRDVVRVRYAAVDGELDARLWRTLRDRRVALGEVPGLRAPSDPATAAELVEALLRECDVDTEEDLRWFVEHGVVTADEFVALVVRSGSQRWRNCQAAVLVAAGYPQHADLLLRSMPGYDPTFAFGGADLSMVITTGDLSSWEARRCVVQHMSAAQFASWLAELDSPTGAAPEDIESLIADLTSGDWVGYTSAADLLRLLLEQRPLPPKGWPPQVERVVSAVLIDAPGILTRLSDHQPTIDCVVRQAAEVFAPLGPKAQVGAWQALASLLRSWSGSLRGLLDACVMCAPE